MLGDADRVRSQGRHNHDSAVVGRRDVDVVESNTRASDDPQIGAGCQQIRSDLGAVPHDHCASTSKGF
jgi:hypothetical protein